jgi:hypothetical protein
MSVFFPHNELACEPPAPRLQGEVPLDSSAAIPVGATIQRRPHDSKKGLET